MMEHIGDITAIGATTKRNYIADPGLHRTLLGDGLATCLASAFGGPANTTYGENTGVLIHLLSPFKEHIKSITTDNGTEFACHEMIAKSLWCYHIFC